MTRYGHIALFRYRDIKIFSSLAASLGRFEDLVGGNLPCFAEAVSGAEKVAVLALSRYRGKVF
jgi:hypothetical protein